MYLSPLRSKQLLSVSVLAYLQLVELLVSLFLFRHFSSLRPLSVNSFFALDCPTCCGACFGDVTIAAAYCKPPCTIHIGWGFVEV
jgi:hypothetical protein